MADHDEVAHAAIGIDLNIDGFEQLRHVSDALDSVIDTFKGASRIADEFREKMSHIGGDAAEKITKSTGAVRDMRDTLNQAKDMTGQVTGSTDKLASGFRTATDASKRLKDSMHFDANVGGLTSGIKQVRGQFGDAVKDVDHFKHSLDFGGAGKFNLGGSIAKSTDELNQFKHAYNGISDKKVASISGNFGKIPDKVEKSSNQVKTFGDRIDAARERTKRFHDILLGSFAGNLLSNGVQNLTSDLWNATKAGFKLAEGGQQIKTQWKAIGIGDTGTQKMLDEIGEIRSKANMSGAAIDSMQKRYYALTSNAKEARELTDEMAAFGSAAGKSDSQIQQIGLSVSRFFGSKTVGAGFFNRAFGQMPELREQIVKASGMTNQAFNKLLANSKVTGTEVEKWMVKASKHSGAAWTEFAKTTQGKMALIKGTWTNMTAAFAKPLVGGLTSVVADLAKSRGGLTAVTKQLEAMSATLGKHVGDALGDGIKFIVQNRKPISEVVGSLTSIGKNLALGAWKSIEHFFTTIGGKSGPASHGLKGMANGLHDVAKQRNAIQTLGKALLAVWATTKIVKFAMSIRDVFRSLKDLAKGFKDVLVWIKANPYLAIAAAVAMIAVALIKLYQHNKKFRKFVNGLFKAAKKAFGDIEKVVAQMVRGFDRYITALSKAVNKHWGNLFKDMISDFKAAWRTIKDILQILFDFFTGHWSRLGKDINKLTKQMWSDVKDWFKSGFDYINDLTGGRLGDMIKGFQNAWKAIGKGWHDFWNGIDNWFSGLWKSIVGHVQDGINDVIKVLNDGIGGIDDVIHMFGGSKTAIGKIGYVHLATGTGAIDGVRKKITKPTMAILNDGHDSPETHNQEVVYHPNGLLEAIKGINTPKLLEPHAEVIKASDARDLGLTTKHFKKGTGFLSGVFNSVVHSAKKVGSGVVNSIKSGLGGIGNFASKAWHGATHLLSTIKKLIKNPGKYLSEIMGGKPSEKGPILNDFSGGFFDATKKQASKWWSALWNMASGKLGSGGSGGDTTGLLKAVEKYGHGHRYVWGAAGPDSFDCSGLVMYALKHAFGIDYPHFSGSQYSRTKHISESEAQPGDLVFWGPNKHVGVYAGHGKYFSAFSPSAHPNIGMYSLAGSVPGYHPIFGAVKGLSHSKGSSKHDKHATGLNGLIQNETGGMMKWIEKHLAPLMDVGGNDGNPGGQGVTRWRKVIKQAAQAMHVSLTGAKMSAILARISKESSGNPNIHQQVHDINSASGHPAQGLLQYVPSTFAAWAVKGHDSITSGYDQLLTMFNDSNWFNDISAGGGWGPSGHRRRAKGGPVKANEPYIVGEKGWEMITPDKDGTVIPHDTAKNFVKNAGSKHITIQSPVKVNIQGNADKATIDHVGKMLSKRDDDLIDKLSEAFGFNDDGGVIY